MIVHLSPNPGPATGTCLLCVDFYGKFIVPLNSLGLEKSAVFFLGQVDFYAVKRNLMELMTRSASVPIESAVFAIWACARISCAL